MLENDLLLLLNLTKYTTERNKEIQVEKISREFIKKKSAKFLAK